MTVKEIVKKYLEENGLEGLCGLDCGCNLDDLMPCSCCCEKCVPGYGVHCTKCGNWVMTEDIKDKYLARCPDCLEK